ncbi:DNA-directed DNA polymerase [Malassezia equina]|uniref:DNA-directed DNA polymerase n=1 Tax=Malassezia equina TaxID=1381935 RepID=A0AAF0EBR3_9BASI|nr:DNA-directed DNA polymerase [Malassezia equina]
MDAPVPMEPNLAAAVVPEREPTVVMEDTIVPEVPENVTTAEEAPVPTPAPTGARKVSRPVQPPQKGTTLFPIARVSKIIKADSAVDICSKEATFLISAATELFVKKFAEEGCTNARLDKRKMVRYDDMEIVPTAVPLSVAMKQREERMNVDANRDDAVGPEPEEADEEDAVMDDSMVEEPPVDTSASDWPTMEETDEGLVEEAEALTDGQGTEAPLAEP